MLTSVLKTWSVAVSFVVFLVAFALGFVFVRTVERHRLESSVSEAQQFAASRSSALQRQIDRAIASASALASVVEQHGTIEDFDGFARHLIDSFGGITCLQLAPGGVVSQVYPLAGHEEALGHDLLNDPERRASALAAIDSRSLHMSGPVELKQGGRAIIGRAPVFLPATSAAPEQAFWGFAIVLISVADLLESAGLVTDTAGQFSLAIWRTDPATGERLDIHRFGDLGPAQPVTMRVETHGGTWNLDVAPRAGWPTGWPLPHQTVLIFIAALAVSCSLFALLHIPERLRLEVRLQTRRLVAVNESLRQEITRRRQAEVELRAMHERLEHRVDERTAELTRANELLEREIEVRRRTENERRRLEKRMQDAQKLESLGVLAGGIAHDFNNLLVSILGNASLALIDLDDESAAREPVRDIKTAARRAADLTNQLLAYSGRGRFLVESIDVSALVREMGGLLETVISENALLRFELAQDLPPIDADVTQMRQVIMNLITNASDAVSRRGGVIAVRTGIMQADPAFFRGAYLQPCLPGGSYVYLEVADDGEGMEQETKTRIFDPFFSTKFTGRGLGLAAVLGIVRSHQGAIHIDSDAGRGTVFRIVIPPGTVGVAKEPEPLSLDEAWAGQGCALVVDDETSVRTTSGRILERMGFDVLMARDGLEALALFESHSEINLVLLDLTMPRLSGEEVLERMLQVRVGVPVILASGYAEEEIDRRFIGARPAGFVQKPFEVRTLMRVVRSVMSPGSETPRVHAEPARAEARPWDASQEMI